MKTQLSVTYHTFTGQIIALLAKPQAETSNRLRGLQISSAQGKHTLKFSKKLRSRLADHPEPWLQPGVWVEITVKQKFEADSGQPKLTIKAIQHLSTIAAFPTPESIQSSETPVLKPAQPPKEKILFCQKSDCMKRQGKAVCAALEAALEEYELTDRVALKGTGCLKRCSAGPNLVMPDKVRYSKVRPQDVPAIVAKHFGEKPIVAERPAS